MLAPYCVSLNDYFRLPTREVRVGGLLIGNGHPIRIQTMTTTDTMDTEATVAQTIRCIEAGAELVRITAPSKKEAANLAEIKKRVRAAGFDTPLIADIHFTPNAAEVAATIIEKVRINPGNYIDKKRFDIIDYTDAEYAQEVDRIRDRFTPLVRICREQGTAMRIGTNHGSLSDRIMSRFGDTPMGMVESAMEFLRIARSENYHQIILSMKSSNPLVMVQAYRLLVRQMDQEFGECYPLHLGVTEAGDGEDGRIKSAIGIGSLLEDGIGDTIRVSLTEDPEFEIPVCRDIVKRYATRKSPETAGVNTASALPYDPFNYRRRHSTLASADPGAQLLTSAQVPVVVADLASEAILDANCLEAVGYRYHPDTDKWDIADSAADFIYTGVRVPDFALPGTLRIITDIAVWKQAVKSGGPTLAGKLFPLQTVDAYLAAQACVDPDPVTFLSLDVALFSEMPALIDRFRDDHGIVLVLSHSGVNAMTAIRQFVAMLTPAGVTCPVILRTVSTEATVDEQLIHFATACGGLLLDGMGDGLWLNSDDAHIENTRVSGRTYMPVRNRHQFLNNTAFSILQATRTRISKTEYISCPSCGRTLFDLQETTAKIRSATQHLKGVKIAIMGCIVNGPGEMADADFGYVGSGPGKITLYKSKEIVKKNISSETAVSELIQLLKDNGAWVEVG